LIHEAADCRAPIQQWTFGARPFQMAAAATAILRSILFDKERFTNYNAILRAFPVWAMVGS
jgi:hypothetical protein